MQKKFFVSRNTVEGSMAAPEMDRFSRIEKLNAMLQVGWVIKGFENDEKGSYFLLENDKS